MSAYTFVILGQTILGRYISCLLCGGRTTPADGGHDIRQKRHSAFCLKPQRIVVSWLSIPLDSHSVINLSRSQVWLSLETQLHSLQVRTSIVEPDDAYFQKSVSKSGRYQDLVDTLAFLKTNDCKMPQSVSKISRT